MTGVVVAGVILGLILGVGGLVMSWRGASLDVAHARRDAETAKRLSRQEQDEMAALPSSRTSEQSAEVYAASERRYAAAGLDRPTWDNVTQLPLLAAAREKQRSSTGIKRGVVLAAVGLVVATVTALVGL
jgi:hypothetical protein